MLILVLSAVTVTACNTDEKLFNAFVEKLQTGYQAGTLQTKRTTAIGETLLAETSVNYTFAENGSATVQTTVRKLNENPVEGETYLESTQTSDLTADEAKEVFFDVSKISKDNFLKGQYTLSTEKTQSTLTFTASSAEKMFGVTTEEAQRISDIQVTVCVETEKLECMKITHKRKRAPTVPFPAPSPNEEQCAWGTPPQPPDGSRLKKRSARLKQGVQQGKSLCP